MKIRDKQYILPTDEHIRLLANLFRNGMALDLVDTEGKQENPNLPDDERYIYEVSDAALEQVDLDKLSEESEALGIPEKYPEFDVFLKSLELENDSHEERMPQDESVDEDIDETEIEVPTDETGELSLKDNVLKNIIEGRHTGKESFNEKYAESDEYRRRLTEDYNQMIEQAAEQSAKQAEKMIADSYARAGQREAEVKKITEKDGSLHLGESNAGDVTNVIGIAGDKKKNKKPDEKESNIVSGRKKGKNEAYQLMLQKRGCKKAPKLKKPEMAAGTAIGSEVIKQSAETSQQSSNKMKADSYSIAGQREKAEQTPEIIANPFEIPQKQVVTNSEKNNKRVEKEEVSHVIGIGNTNQKKSILTAGGEATTIISGTAKAAEKTQIHAIGKEGEGHRTIEKQEDAIDNAEHNIKNRQAKKTDSPFEIQAGINAEKTKNKIIADSYSQAGQRESTNTQKSNTQDFFSGQAPSEDGLKKNDNKDSSRYTSGKENNPNIIKNERNHKVDVGIFAKRRGNQIYLQINGREKAFTMRSDGTINLNGMTAKVYDMGNGKIFVGWKNETISGGKVTVNGGKEQYCIEMDGETVKVGPTAILLGIHHKIKAEAMAPEVDAASFAGNINFDPFDENSTFYKFNQNGKTHTVEGTNYRIGNNKIEHILRENEFVNVLEKQGKRMRSAMNAEMLNQMHDIKWSQNTVNVITKNYDRIIASNGDAKTACRYNKYLEETYLAQEEREKLSILRKSIKGAGFTTNVDKLKQQMNNGEISGNEAKHVAEYIKEYEKTREKIVRDGILKAGTNDKEKRYVETGFFGASMNILVSEYGLPKDEKEIQKLLKKGRLTKEQEEIAKNAMKINRALFVRKEMKKQASRTVRKTGGKIKRGYHKIKSYTNKYLGDDYTVRGAMIGISAVVTAAKIPMKAVKTVFKTRDTFQKLRQAARTTKRATKAVAGAARAGAKAASVGMRTIRNEGLKKTARKTAQKATTKLKRKVQKTAFKVQKITIKSVKKVVTAAVKIIIRIIQMLTSALFSILGPALFAIIFVLILIFSILSFIKNDGSEIYYDAGDEDTAEVVQEMVDVLTLCHASFRDALSNRYGSGAATSASGVDDYGYNAPQLKKGDSSKVKELYNITSGSWWNFEFTYPYSMAASTRQGQLLAKLKSGELSVTNNGGYAFVNNKYYLAATTLYWGKSGDVIKVEFDGTVPSPINSNVMYVIIADTKAYEHTHYLDGQKEGLYGHVMTPDGKRDLLEFVGMKDEKTPNMNNKGVCPEKVTNLGSILDGTFDENLVGSSSGVSLQSDAEIIYRQDIDQEVYQKILDRNNNIYMTFPEEQKVPVGISPTPTPTPKPEISGEEHDKTEYAFYNNNQELISMVLAMFDFDINSSTSAKKTLLMISDSDGENEAEAELSYQAGYTNKINEDTWRLITLLEKHGMNLEGYQEGGYDDLKYSALMGLFNATHIITTTNVYEYHEGPDGTINPVYDENGRIIGQNNTDGFSYQIPLTQEVTYTRNIYDEYGFVTGTFREVVTEYVRDANGDLVYQTLYSPCQGHRKQSAAVITLFFDDILNLKDWWNENIYDVDDFDKENPNYSSDDEDDENYQAKETLLKRTIQCIKKPDYYKAVGGTCNNSSTSSSSFSPGTMSESQQEVARKVFQFATSELGFTQNQAYGLLINIYRESGFIYTAVETATGEGYGLCQWSYGRKAGLINWCNMHPGSGAYNTLEGQLSYLKAECNELANDVWTGGGIAGFRRCQTAEEAAEYILRDFERPNAEEVTKRIGLISQDLATIKGYLE